ncbi:protein of unknown function (DUF1917) domain containing protein [Elaphomyces granulatus]
MTAGEKLESGEMDIDEDNETKIDDVLSDESSFYGDEQRASLDDRESAFDPLPYWDIHPYLLSTIAYQNRSAAAAGAKRAKKDSLHSHPHDGRQECWQLTESVTDFLSRLPPSTALKDVVGPWLFVRNPKDDASEKGQGNVPDLVSAGTALLRDFENDKSRLEAEHALKKSRTSAPLTRALNTLRQSLENHILVAAQRAGVVTGKWMLFPPPEQVDEVWATVAGATVTGELGIGAKVATRDGLGRDRLIAVYTKDYRDEGDVRRVLLKLVRLGLVNKMQEKPIYYKLDAYTYLEIQGNNQYGLRASKSSSRDILPGEC